MKKQCVLLAALAIACGAPVGLTSSQSNMGFTAVAQNNKVTGVVTDASGEPLIGATVMVKGTSRGTSTDIDGRYSINAPQGSTLVISYIGSKPMEIKVTGSNLDVTMESSDTNLDEVVVTALGIKKERKSLGYAVDDLKAEELMRNKTANAISSLSGKIAGVNITQSSGAAGAGAQIILRGGTSGSENRDNQPLFVVDGIIYDNSSSVVGNTGFDGSGKTSTTTSNRVMDINPEDIENMSILKGPAASALYGSRAANGVVLITTKKGKAGNVEINLNAKYISSRVKTLPDVQNQYRRGFMQDNYDETTKAYINTTFNPKSYQSWGNEIGNDPVYDNIGNFFQTGGIWDTNLSISGGTETGNFYLSGSYYDQTGVVPETGYKKTTFRFNGEQKYKIFTFGANAAYSDARTARTLTSGGLYGSSGSGALYGVYTWAPSNDMTHYLNEDGTRFKQFDDLMNWEESDNPYWIINNNKLSDQTERFTGGFNVKADITDWWFINYRMGVDSYTQTNHNFVAPNGVVKQEWQQGMMSDNDLKYRYLSTNLMTNFNKQFGDFNFNLMLGTSTDYTKYKRNYRMATHFAVPEFFSFSNAGENDKKFEQSNTRKRLVAVFGEFRADWRNAIFLTVTGRNDWTSTLPLDNRSYFYPSVSGAIAFTELMGEAKPEWLSFGKIRASWAKVGKDTGAYETATYLWPTGTYLLGKVGRGNTWTRGNPFIKPEMSRSSEFGIELRFLQNRLKFDLCYYNNKSYNQILSPRGPQSTGYIFCSINAGTVYNKGLEFSLSGTPIQTKDFTWETGINIAGNRGTMEDLPAGMDIMYVTDVQYAGAKAATFSGGSFMGISGTQWARNPEGKIILDKNGMPTPDNSKTTFQVGNREAKFTGGWNNTFTYKNLSLNMLWEFRVGGDVFNGTKYTMTMAGVSQFSADFRNEPLTIAGVIEKGKDADGVMQYEDVSNTWEPNKMYNFNGQDMPGSSIIKRYYTNEYNTEVKNWLTTVNSLRLRSITLSYDLPKAFLAKTKVIKRASISASATNLLLFTNYDGDPEVAASGSGTGGSSSVGFDYCGVPATQSFSLGVNLTF
ncbi:MAG: SusC/RagA family TonB-linked outer membrane protein [Bacteroidales bacterium]|nr:SusC/RagA family TonB-linked outer membrane protein [Candidatus Sodaliphilus aphodohippi]